MAITGGCQCGAISWKLDAEPVKAIECNCSRCKPIGLLFDFFPAAAFELGSGEDMLTTYRFNRKAVDHVFCKICGTESFFRLKRPGETELVAINMRCVEGLNLSTLKVVQHDGAGK